MKKLYKGLIINATKPFETGKYYLNILEGQRIEQEDYHGRQYIVLSNSSKELYSYFSKKPYSKLSELYIKLIDIIKNKKDVDKDSLDKEIISNIKIKPTSTFGAISKIIYEKIYDSEGNEYGKEILTGAIFPIILTYSDYDVSYSSGDIEKVFYDEEYHKCYMLENKTAQFNEYGRNEYLFDTDGNKYTITSGERDRLYTAVCNRESVFIDKRYATLEVHYPNNYIIEVKPKIIFPESQRIEYIITEETTANEREIKQYTEKHKKRLFNNQLKTFKNRLNFMQSSNYLGDNVVFIDKKTPKIILNESSIMKELQELEFLLEKLKGVSEEDYNKLSLEKDELLNQEGNLGLSINPLSIKSIIALENKVELAYLYNGGNSKMILDYLNNHICKCLENIKNNSDEISTLTIDDLDRINEQIISNKNVFSIKDQSEILRKVATLYFFALYENIDNLTIDDIKDSYVISNIKRIIIVINTLKDEGIINNVSSNLFDIKSIDELIELIKKIEFIPRENISQEEMDSFIKKIQL